MLRIFLSFYRFYQFINLESLSMFKLIWVINKNFRTFFWNFWSDGSLLMMSRKVYSYVYLIFIQFSCNLELIKQEKHGNWSHRTEHLLGKWTLKNEYIQEHTHTQTHELERHREKEKEWEMQRKIWGEVGKNRC